MLNNHLAKTYSHSFPKQIYSNKHNGQNIYNIVENSRLFKLIPQILVLQIENLDCPTEPKAENNFSVSIDNLAIDDVGNQISNMDRKKFNFFKKIHEPNHFGKKSPQMLTLYKQKPITKNENLFKEPKPQIAGEKEFETSDGNTSKPFHLSSNLCFWGSQRLP